MQSKNELRKFAKNLRENLDMKSISAKILQVFQASALYKNAANIGLYSSYGSEPNLRKLFEDTFKNFFLPKITASNSLTFHPYKLGEKLEPDKYGISEPITEPVNPKTLDLIIVPALMADKRGFRLGYGKGYYDSFLTKNKISATKIVFLPEELFVEKLPVDDFDVCMNFIITPKGLYSCT